MIIEQKTVYLSSVAGANSKLYIDVPQKAMSFTFTVVPRVGGDDLQINRLTKLYDNYSIDSIDYNGIGLHAFSFTPIISGLTENALRQGACVLFAGEKRLVWEVQALPGVDVNCTLSIAFYDEVVANTSFCGMFDSQKIVAAGVTVDEFLYLPKVARYEILLSVLNAVIPVTQDVRDMYEIGLPDGSAVLNTVSGAIASNVTPQSVVQAAYVSRAAHNMFRWRVQGHAANPVHVGLMIYNYL